MCTVILIHREYDDRLIVFGGNDDFFIVITDIIYDGFEVVSSMRVIDHLHENPFVQDIDNFI
jgi:hypothetical protein